LEETVDNKENNRLQNAIIKTLWIGVCKGNSLYAKVLA
jgi:hypothetical protein